MSSARWLCQCECGGTHLVTSQRLLNGTVTSCGCYRRDVKTTHGGWGTREYSIWQKMKQRCNNPNHKHFQHYGGRGIKVCPQWADFAQFRADMGPCPTAKHELERVDNNSGYSPENCRWATRYQQMLNRRTSVYLEFRGERMTMSQFVERHGISYSRFRSQWRVQGKSVEDALAACLDRS